MKRITLKALRLRFFPHSPNSPRRGSLFIAVYSAIAAVMLFTITFLLVHRSTTSEGTYALNDEQPQLFEFPLKLSSAPAGTITARFTLTVQSPLPSYFFALPDDCLESLEVNGIPVLSPDLPLCDYGKGGTINLKEYLRSGDNTVVARITNAGGDAQFLLQPAWSDPTTLVPLIVLLGLFVLFIIVQLIHRRPPLWIVYIILLLLFGASLRMFYLVTTPYWVRGHDTDGHIEYMEHISAHWSLPDPNQGWEFWQPPLYYVFGGAWLSAAESLGLSRLSALWGVQAGSLMLSVLTLLICIWIGMRIFPDHKERQRALPLFLFLFTFFPGLIFLSARINNDVLVVVLSFLSIALLFEWWRRGKMLHWALLMIAISLSILSKNTALLLLPVAYGCLILRRAMPWKRKAIQAIVGIMLIALCAGWLSVYRALQDTDQDPIIGNTSTLNSGLAVANGPSAFLVFNPLKVIHIPYNNPWSDESRRQYFWEYWYRSAFFGEFDFGQERKLLASWVLLWSMIVLVIGLIGMFRSVRERFWDTIPLLMLTIVLAAGHAVFRFRYPFGSSQDFRYSLPLLIPFAAFVTFGIIRCRSELLQRIMYFSINAFAAFCIAALLYA